MFDSQSIYYWLIWLCIVVERLLILKYGKHSITTEFDVDLKDTNMNLELISVYLVFFLYVILFKFSLLLRDFFRESIYFINVDFMYKLYVTVRFPLFTTIRA